MTTPIKLSQELIDILKEKRIIIIRGKTDCGKTTESCEIAYNLGKPVYAVRNIPDTNDDTLYSSMGFTEIKIGRDFDNTQQLKKAIRGVKDSVIIFDDFNEISRITRDYVIDNLRRKLKKSKRNLQLIINFHNDKGIPKKFLTEDFSMLITKKLPNISEAKLKKYYLKDYIAIPTIEYIDKVNGWDSVYILKDGLFYHRDGNTNLIKQGEFKSKGSHKLTRQQEKEITNLVLQGETYKDLAIRYNVSKSSIAKIVKSRLLSDEEYKKNYKKIRDRKTQVGKPKSGITRKREKSGINLYIYKETLTGVNNTKTQPSRDMKHIQEIGDLATEIIGEKLYVELKKLTENHTIEWVDMSIIKGLGGSDITIKTDDKQIEIEVKNYKITKKEKYLTPYYINRFVKNRFTEEATHKYLFCSGRGINEKARKLLKSLNIRYKRITNKQIRKNNPNLKHQKHRIKKRMKDFIAEI